MAERTPMVKVGGYWRELPAGDTTAGGGGSSARTVTAKTADYTVLAGDSGTIFTNGGAAGLVVFTLPDTAGCTSGVTYFTFYAREAGFSIRIQVDGSDHLYYWTNAGGAADVTGGGIMRGEDVGCFLTVLYVGGGVWMPTAITDNWFS